ncbi:MAG: NAD(P)/FAD-dependent oxidoreductase [Candidatus Dormibacteria bacterium]
MTSIARVGVVGSGIAGLTLAWELARRGAQVVIVQSARPRTSLVAAGMLAPMPESSVTSHLLRFGVEALRFYPQFLQTLAEDSRRDVGFRRSGVLRLAATEADAGAIREGVGSYEAAGMPSQWLSPRALRRLRPGLPDGLAGALLSFDEAQVQPDWLLAALQEAAARHGVQTVDGEVVALPRHTPGAALRLADGRLMDFDRAVLAAGSWAGELGGEAVPVRPVKGQLLVFRDASGPDHIIYSGHNYVLTKADSTVVLGGTVEEAGFSLAADAEAETLRDVIPLTWPGLRGIAAATRVGLRPATPDELPIVGAIPGRPGLYAFTGHYRNGFLLAPHQARLASIEILDGHAQELLGPLRPRRFERHPPEVALSN